MSDSTARKADRDRSVASFVSIKRHHLVTIVTVAISLFGYQLMSWFGFPRLEIIFPSLTEILGGFSYLLLDGAIYPHLYLTGRTVVLAVIAASLVGIIGGLLLGRNRFVAEGFEPLLYYFSSLPKITLYPIFLVAFGIGLESRVSLGFLSALFPITVNSITGSLNIQDNLEKVGHVYRLTKWEMVKLIYIPSTLPHILNGLRLGIAAAIITVVLAELFASRGGIGNRIVFFFNNLQTDRMYAALIMLFIISLVINLGLLWLQGYLAKKGYGTGESRTQEGVNL